MHRAVTRAAVGDRPPAARAAWLLALPEDQWFDRRSARIDPKDLANAEIGFANAEGGTIVVGLHGGRVEGEIPPAKHNALVQAGIEYADPPVHARPELVECRDEAGRPAHLLVIEIEPSASMHANVKDEVYLRAGDKNIRLSFRQRLELAYVKGQASFESDPVPGATAGDLAMALVRRYARGMGHRGDPLRLLRARGMLTSDGKLTAAGALLFASEPQRWFPAAHVRVVRYRGAERGSGSRQNVDVAADVRCEGPIPEQLRAARLAVRRVVPARRALRPDGRFGPVPLVPEDAWLEGLVNAVVHRSYSLAGDHVRVEVFDDRVEVYSPGGFPGLSDVSDPLSLLRFARNPRIARVCAGLGFGQEFGEGIRRMFEEMRLHGLADPAYLPMPGGVRLTLSAEPVDRELESRLPSDSRVVLALLRDAGRLGTGEIADALGLSRPVVIRRLNALRDAGLVDWVGRSPKDPRAYWTLH